MPFSNITFLILFLPLALALYYLVPKGWKNVILLLISLLFFSWGEPVYFVLMILSILINYVYGLDIYNKLQNSKEAKINLICAIVVNLLILGFFRYYGFLVHTINDLFSTQMPYRQLATPIGISIYTFQALSYLIDVYRGKVEAQKNIWHYALFKTMFPQLIAGPIVRYTEIEAQLKDRALSMEMFGQGAMCFILGLGKKVLLAGTFAHIFSLVQNIPEGNVSVLTAWVGVIAFGLQIYFDFSGYADMAVGLGKMFGFELPKNFDYPYIATSIADFWQRWNITLGNWFREYVYQPLGGEERELPRNILNILFVWGLIGLWHGGSWNFVLWGLYYGILLVAERYVGRNILAVLPKMVGRITTIILVMMGWPIFFSATLSEAFRYLRLLFGGGASAFVDIQGWFLLFNNWLFFVIAGLTISAAGMRLLHFVLDAFASRRVRRIVICTVYFGIFFLALAFLV